MTVVQPFIRIINTANLKIFNIATVDNYYQVSPFAFSIAQVKLTPSLILLTKKETWAIVTFPL
jgi:hypothetical protein